MEQEQIIEESVAVNEESNLTMEIVEDAVIKKVKKGRALDVLIKVFGVMGSLTTAFLFVNILFL